jgi:hypothetical protein
MITEFVTSANKILFFFFFFFTTNIGYGEARKCMCSNLPKQASVGKVCIYVCSKHESLKQFLICKTSKGEGETGVPKPDEQEAHHRIMMSLPTLSQVQTSVGWV